MIYCFAEFNIFVWFDDIWDVAKNLGIAIYFFSEHDNVKLFI